MAHAIAWTTGKYIGVRGQSVNSNFIICFPSRIVIAAHALGEVSASNAVTASLVALHVCSAEAVAVLILLHIETM